MYTTTGEKLSWNEFNSRREAGENLFIGNYPKEDKIAFKTYANSHTIAETKEYIETNELSLDIMYSNGRPDCYDRFNGECAGIKCKDGWLWNLYSHNNSNSIIYNNRTVAITRLREYKLALGGER